MAIRNSLLGGTDWNEISEEGLYGQDLNDTFNRIVDYIIPKIEYTGTDVDQHQEGTTKTHVIGSLSSSDLTNKTTLKVNINAWLKMWRDAGQEIYFKVEISNDGGSSWTNIGELRGQHDGSDVGDSVGFTSSVISNYTLSSDDLNNGIDIRVSTTCTNTISEVVNKGVYIYLI